MLLPVEISLSPQLPQAYFSFAVTPAVPPTVVGCKTDAVTQVVLLEFLQLFGRPLALLARAGANC
jgi:hypothetical protein